MQSFSAPFMVEGFTKNPDYEMDYNADIRLKKNWTCINMNDLNPCIYTDKKLVYLNETDSS